MINNKPEDMTSAERLTVGAGMLGQLLSDMGDESFWNDPDWDSKNPRDSVGVPIKQ